MTTKLSDAQLVVLSAACQRPNRNLLPLPERMKGGAAQKIIASLIGNALIEELAAGPGEPVWREGEDGGRTTLQATAAAFQAVRNTATGAAARRPTRHVSRTPQPGKPGPKAKPQRLNHPPPTISAQSGEKSGLV